MRSDRYLDVVRRLALLTPFVVGCAAKAAPTVAAPAPPPSPTTSAAPSTSSALVHADEPTPPCRCAWDTVAASAPRVCADGEIDHAGNACVRGADHSPTSGEKIYLPPVSGPLAPPEIGSAFAIS